MLRHAILSAALIAAPVSAQAAPVRASAPVAAEKEQLVGLLWSYLIVPALIAVVLAVVLGGDDNEMPTSP
jgi:hypothetical protein